MTFNTNLIKKKGSPDLGLFFWLLWRNTLKVVLFKRQAAKGLVEGVGLHTVLANRLYMVQYTHRKQRRFQLARVY